MTLESVKEEIKSRRKKNKSKKSHKYRNKFILLILITLALLVTLKNNKEFKDLFYEKVFEETFPFSKVNDLYEKYFGTSIPFQGVFKNDTESVFKETLTYKKKEAYLDGVKLEVTNEYLVPNLESGMVVFIGEKEDYGNTVIIQQIDGVDVWYANIKNVSVKLYDYVEKGELVGDTNDNSLILVFKQNGKVIDYEKYVS
jgi:stage IV sporulation protein FA